MTAHFSDALENAHDKAEREGWVDATIESFGDPEMFGLLIRDAKRRCLGERGINYAALGGVTLFSALFLAAIALGCGFPVFLNPAGLMLAVRCTAGLNAMTLGFCEFFSTLFSLRVLCVFVPPQTIPPNCRSSLKTTIGHTYRALGIAVTMGGIQCLALWDEPSRAGTGMVLALLGALYCLLFAEGVLRPALHRIQGISIRNVDGARVRLADGNDEMGGATQ